MDFHALQQTLRHFAAEREWQPFHTPKNLAMALMVEAAELAEIFQWMTPEQSQGAHLDRVVQERIADEVADVLLYLLQLADHAHIDLKRAVGRKLQKNAKKHPPTRPGLPAGTAVEAGPETHVLVDWENVQPSDEDIRALVPDVTDVWVFHGPGQKRVAERVASFGERATCIPIARTGKNALDFHLSFYMGYIASRRPDARFVVLSNDKGYGPMLEHAADLGFAARALGFGRQASRPAGTKQAGTKQAATKRGAGRRTAAKAAPPPAQAPASAPAKAMAPAAKAAASGKAARPAGSGRAAKPVEAGGAATSEARSSSSRRSRAGAKAGAQAAAESTSTLALAPAPAPARTAAPTSPSAPAPAPAPAKKTRRTRATPAEPAREATPAETTSPARKSRRTTKAATAPAAPTPTPTPAPSPSSAPQPSPAPAPGRRKASTGRSAPPPAPTAPAPAPTPAPAPSASGLDADVRHVRQGLARASGKPSRLKALLALVRSLLGSGADADRVDAVLTRLVSAGAVAIDSKGGVRFPEAGGATR